METEIWTTYQQSEKPMKEYNIPDEHPSDNWTSYIPGGGMSFGEPKSEIQRKTPMIECPNCGKHEFTLYREENWEQNSKPFLLDKVLRKVKRFLLMQFDGVPPWWEKKGWNQYWKCQECKLREEV